MYSASMFRIKKELSVFFNEYYFSYNMFSCVHNSVMDIFRSILLKQRFKPFSQKLSVYV